uniref:Uncharacterized protein n=2 Tax=Panagrellus redivivus TaxID=6233 RepID=A0A7E4W6H6_PANRE
MPSGLGRPPAEEDVYELGPGSPDVEITFFVLVLFLDAADDPVAIATTSPCLGIGWNGCNVESMPRRHRAVGCPSCTDHLAAKPSPIMPSMMTPRLSSARNRLRRRRKFGTNGGLIPPPHPHLGFDASAIGTIASAPRQRVHDAVLPAPWATTCRIIIIGRLMRTRQGIVRRLKGPGRHLVLVGSHFSESMSVARLKAERASRPPGAGFESIPIVA